MLPTTPIERMWFSIMIGWLLKVLIVRFGGSSLYQSAKPFFLGLILGETAAAGMWLLVSVILYLQNIPYHAISIMPM